MNAKDSERVAASPSGALNELGVFSADRMVQMRGRRALTVQGVQNANTLQEKQVGALAPLAGFRFLGEGLRDSLPKTRGHFVKCPPEQLRRAWHLLPRVAGTLVALAALPACGARRTPQPEYQEADSWNTEELARQDPLLPAHERQQRNASETRQGGSSPYEQLYTPTPEGGHDRGTSPYSSPGGAPRPTGRGGDTLAP